MTSSICLTAIVKDESAVIARMLHSVRDVIDCYAIVDTGSSDDTIDVIRNEMRGVDGRVISRPWRGFDGSRNDALALARDSGADYWLMMDADHVLDAKELRSVLDADGYYLEHVYATLVYPLPILCKLSLPWFYEMPVHEYLECRQPFALERMRAWEACVIVHPDGARSRDRLKFAKDAAVLKKFCLKHPEHARAMYYYAQSERDAGNAQTARLAYLKRSRMAGWDEEAWSACYEAAKLAEKLGDDDLVPDAYLAAYRMRPNRAEPLAALASFYRRHGDFALAYLYAKQAVQTPFPVTDRLFVEHDVYRWCALDELGIAAFYVGRLEESRQVFQRLLTENVLPQSHRPRIEQNLAFCA